MRRRAVDWTVAWAAVPAEGAGLPWAAHACTPPLLRSLLPRPKMVFGQRPPPLEEDPVSRQPCLAACATGIGGAGRCHKLD